MIPKNKRFSLVLVLLMCLTLCLTALSEGDTEEVSITIFDENGEVILGETPEPEVTPEPTVDPSQPVYEADGSILLTMTFAGDMTIGSNVQSSGTSIFDKELEKQKGDINFPFRNVRDILLSDDLTMVNFEGTLTTEGRNPDKTDNEFLFRADPAMWRCCPRAVWIRCRWKTTMCWTWAKAALRKPRKPCWPPAFPMPARTSPPFSPSRA